MAPSPDTVALSITLSSGIPSSLLAEDSLLLQLCRGVWSVLGGHYVWQGVGRLSASEPNLHRISITSDSDEGVYDKQAVQARVGVMLVIFFVSLFASSFPSISKRIKFLRIPKIVFFIGKHFGTGVILSTALVHLLQDAFTSLQDPRVVARWRSKDWAGLIVLGSLLYIFFVEYISTSYVDRLHSFSSVPSSPTTSQPSSPARSPPPELSSGPISTDSLVHEVAGSPLLVKTSGDNKIVGPTEQTPLIHDSAPSQSVLLNARRAQSYSYGSRSQNGYVHPESPFFYGHHRHESRSRHEDHHNRNLRIAAPVIYTPRSEESIRKSATQSSAHVHVHSHSNASEMHTNDSEGCEEDGDLSCEMKVGKKRQIVGILVLQLGIMLHSFVIGLTLAITSGTEFTSLVTAIVFHQLFEGLSLGIRISGIPASKQERDGDRLFPLLNTALMILFAITTPVGIAVGLLAFAGGTDSTQMKFTQGLMCAISAGLLIYAACVEMLAGDFVMDVTLWRSPIWKQAVALMSLLVGAATMALVGG